MELLCLFCPAFISLLIYSKVNNEEIKISKLVCNYFLNALFINFAILIISKIVFKLNYYYFTISFSIKYLLLATVLSVASPYLISKIEELIENKYNLEWLKKSLKDYKYNIIFIFTNFLLFYFFDYFTRLTAIELTPFSSINALSPNLFTLGYCLLITIIIYILPKIFSRICLSVFYIVNTVLYITNYMLLNIKEEAFRFKELGNASEGFAYLDFLMDKISIKFILFLLMSLILFIINFYLLKKIKINKKVKRRIIYLVVGIGAFLGLRYYAISSLGEYAESSFENTLQPKYHYDNFIDSNKSLVVSGIYEYTCRDLYLYFKNMGTSYGSVKEINEIADKYKTDYEPNAKTGIFKDKNVIMIMMESIDKLVVNKETMPTFTKMSNEGWNFANRYSSNLGTLVTEFTSLTGIMYLDTYNTNNDSYPLSLPNLFNDRGYITTSIHENKGAFYNRTSLHKNLGFQNSYFIRDMFDEWDFGNDAELINNDQVYNYIVPKADKKPFFTFITTISGHGSYGNNPYCISAEINEEKECLEYLSKKTDDMLSALLERLKKDGQLDNTVIILYSDHYAYSYNYTEKDLKIYKKLDDNYSMKDIPFIIYSTDIKPQKINKYVSDSDIFPTILNLFDIKYNPEYYGGRDIFSANHPNISFSMNYNWYDGMTYSEDPNADKSDEKYINNSNYVRDMIELNRMILSNDYYAKTKK